MGFPKDRVAAAGEAFLRRFVVTGAHE